jgi:predicted  nucleic acid-binding Zn-ribbon protein
MAEVSNDLIYDVLKQMRGRLTSIEHKVDELKAEMQAFRGHLVAMQQDIHNIYTTLARHEVRLDGIERRLELVEPAAT